MILTLYSIFDVKTGIHHPPHFCHNAGHALRVFGDMFAEPDKMLSKHPEDFQIFEIGTFDDQTAIIEPIKPHLLVTGSQLVASEETPFLETKGPRS